MHCEGGSCPLCTLRLSQLYQWYSLAYRRREPESRHKANEVFDIGVCTFACAKTMDMCLHWIAIATHMTPDPQALVGCTKTSIRAKEIWLQVTTLCASPICEHTHQVRCTVWS